MAFLFFLYATTSLTFRQGISIPQRDCQTGKKLGYSVVLKQGDKLDLPNKCDELISHSGDIRNNETWISSGRTAVIEDQGGLHYYSKMKVLKNRNIEIKKDGESESVETEKDFDLCLDINHILKNKIAVIDSDNDFVESCFNIGPSTPATEEVIKIGEQVQALTDSLLDPEITKNKCEFLIFPPKELTSEMVYTCLQNIGSKFDNESKLPKVIYTLPIEIQNFFMMMISGLAEGPPNPDSEGDFLAMYLVKENRLKQHHDEGYSDHTMADVSFMEGQFQPFFNLTSNGNGKIDIWLKAISNMKISTDSNTSEIHDKIQIAVSAYLMYRSTGVTEMTCDGVAIDLSEMKFFYAANFARKSLATTTKFCEPPVVVNETLSVKFEGGNGFKSTGKGKYTIFADTVNGVKKADYIEGTRPPADRKNYSGLKNSCI